MGVHLQRGDNQKCPRQIHSLVRLKQHIGTANKCGVFALFLCACVQMTTVFLAGFQSTQSTCAGHLIRSSGRVQFAECNSTENSCRAWHRRHIYIFTNARIDKLTAKQDLGSTHRTDTIHEEMHTSSESMLDKTISFAKNVPSSAIMSRIYIE